MLIAGRVLQGVGAIMPVGTAVLSNEFPDEKRAPMLGLVPGVANIGTTLGPLVAAGSRDGPAVAMESS